MLQPDWSPELNPLQLPQEKRQIKRTTVQRLDQPIPIPFVISAVDRHDKQMRTTLLQKFRDLSSPTRKQ